MSLPTTLDPRSTFCEAFYIGGRCPEKKCPYAHSVKDWVKAPRELQNFKKCVLAGLDRCPVSSENCTYAHNNADLKKLRKMKTLRAQGSEITKAEAHVPKAAKQQLITLLYRQDGFFLSELPVRFRDLTGEDFRYKDWGFATLTDSLMSLSKILKLVEGDGNSARIFLSEKAQKKKQKEIDNKVENHQLKLELEHALSEDDSLPDDSSNYSDWDALEEIIAKEQMLCPVYSLVCPVCEMVVAQKRLLLLSCGHLFCGPCLQSCVDRAKRRIYCIRCNCEIKYKKSTFEQVTPVKKSSKYKNVQKLAKLIDKREIRCRMVECNWTTGTVGTWRKHYPVCPLKQRRDRDYYRCALHKTLDDENNIEFELLQVDDSGNHHLSTPRATEADKIEAQESFMKLIRKALRDVEKEKGSRPSGTTKVERRSTKGKEIHHRAAERTHRSTTKKRVEEKEEDNNLEKKERERLRKLIQAQQERKKSTEGTTTVYQLKKQRKWKAFEKNDENNNNEESESAAILHHHLRRVSIRARKRESNTSSTDSSYERKDRARKVVHRDIAKEKDTCLKKANRSHRLRKDCKDEKNRLREERGCSDNSNGGGTESMDSDRTTSDDRRHRARRKGRN